jgi:glycosyltransferase involved in cell wall biosynthesis
VERIKLLIFLQDGVGGAERVSVILGKSLDKSFFHVVFCVVEKGSKTSITDFIPDDYDVIRVLCRKPLKIMCQMYRVIRQEKPHVVFSSVMYLNTKILPLRLMFPKTRFVIRCENYLYTFSRSQHFRVGLTYRWADAIIAQTQEMADELVDQLHIDRRKTMVIQNPVDSELIDKMTADDVNPYPDNKKKRFAASGRFTYQKGFDLLIRAFKKVSDRKDDVELYIIGDKDYASGTVFQEIESESRKMGIDHLVHCVGYQKNPYLYIKHANCFVLSSRWEGLPNVLLEALYLGTPVAAFKCVPVIERIVDDGSNGFLAEKEDVNSLCNAMQKAITRGRVKNAYHSSAISDFARIVQG